MILMQFNNESNKSSGLVVIIEPDNFERMKNADPITLRPKAIGGFIEPIKYPGNFEVLIAFESDIGRCYDMQGNPAALLEHLHRGYKFNALDGVRVTPGDKHGST